MGVGQEVSLSEAERKLIRRGKEVCAKVSVGGSRYRCVVMRTSHVYHHSSQRRTHCMDLARLSAGQEQKGSS
jgi:hypothetical protein